MVRPVTGDQLSWLVNSDEPWTRYRTLVDLLGRREGDADVQAAREEMLAHPEVEELIVQAATWPGPALKRHNDASHPLYALSTLADFGLRADDPQMAEPVQAVLAHQSPEGAFQTLLNVSKSFGGTGEDTWSWMLCDAPTLLYALLAMRLGEDERVRRGVSHLVDLVEDTGWLCVVAPELGKFRGPGRKADPCPIVNLYALKALAQVPQMLESPASRTGAEMLLWHWEHQKERKIYMFGIGSDFRKLKYPFVWYDILHVVDVLSRLPFVQSDRRFLEMVHAITDQADTEGRYTATSIYRPWKGWPFADKKNPSPWITFLVLRILKRIQPAG
jgi:hypothetical protein